MANYWYSPFLIDTFSENKLKLFGFKKLDNYSKIDNKTIIIFKSPHEIISDLLIENYTNDDLIKNLKKGLTTIFNLSKKNKLIYNYHIKFFSIETFRNFVNDNKIELDIKNIFPEINPIYSLLCQNIFKIERDILNLYLDIELIYFKFNNSNETYINKLKNSSLNNNLIEHLQKFNSTCSNLNLSEEKLIKTTESFEQINQLSNIKVKQLLDENEELLKENEELLNKYSSLQRLLKYQKDLTIKGLSLIKKLFESNSNSLKNHPKLLDELKEMNIFKLDSFN